MSSVADATVGEKKTSWPEVVGLPVEEAKKITLKDMPDADVVVLSAGSPVTLDWRSNRVRVFVDTVSQTPTVDCPLPSCWIDAVALFMHHLDFLDCP
ncbi:hypothetical protein BS78_09G053900 [Paspalum vaginatum]|nr:hypothetical protein BS78_09G053900 [Paspalum vaginatum]